MYRPRLRQVLLGGLLTTTLIFGLGLGLAAPAAEHVAYDRTQDVVYGRKHGLAMTLDVFTPREHKNGLGLIWVVSGGWFSSHEAIGEAFVQPFLDRGYTVFAVVHGSQPRYAITDVMEDMHRAVRFIRHHAADYAIDPEKLGIYGASAGGHLSLMQGLAPGEGDPTAKDPVDREPSRVAAVACFFPPTDFLNYGKPGENAMGRGILKDFQAPFDFQTFDAEQGKFVPITGESQILEIGRKISPVTHVTPDDAPSLIHHGDADKLVPIQQAELVIDKLKNAGVDARLVVEKEGQHGWPNLLADLEDFADWFDQHLKTVDQKPAAEPQPAQPTPVVAPVSARAFSPPRKVRVGTAVFGPYGPYPGLLPRIEELSKLVDQMVEQAASRFEGRPLDLAILPETTLSHNSGNALERAVPLEGPVHDHFSSLARKHQIYLLLALELEEQDDKGAFASNAAVLFDRQGKVVGIYRKVHPVATTGTSELESGIRPGRSYPVFNCDFGKLGIQICWDIQFPEGWKALADQGAEIVAWPTASPATVLPASRAVENRYFVVSSAWRNNASIFEPTGMVAARIEPAGPIDVLVHELDLSHALLGWSSALRNGQALTDKFGDRVGYHYSEREDVGLFWSNDPSMSIGEMAKSIDAEEIVQQVTRNRDLYRQEAKTTHEKASPVKVDLREKSGTSSVDLSPAGQVITIDSPRGIGTAKLLKKSGEWPRRLEVRLNIAGLESLWIRAGAVQVQAVVPSRGTPLALLSRKSDDGRLEVLPKTDPHAPVVRFLDREGKPAKVVPNQGGIVQVVLPAALLTPECDSLELEWVDFFR